MKLKAKLIRIEVGRAAAANVTFEAATTGACSGWSGILSESRTNGCPIRFA
jgi:hypothetical protein